MDDFRILLGYQGFVFFRPILFLNYKYALRYVYMDVIEDRVLNFHHCFAFCAFDFG